MLGKQSSRIEQEVFSDLEKLCCQPGYVHALAHLCFRDNVIMYSADRGMKEDDMSKMFSFSRLIRAEISTLLGLMVKAEIIWDLPSPEITQGYMDATERLLGELHDCLTSEFFSGVTKEKIESGFDPFNRGSALREPIFYGGESAYHFQYLDFAVRKYAADEEWLLNNKGFTIDQAVRVAKAIENSTTDRFEYVRKLMLSKSPDQWTIMPAFSFNSKNISNGSGVDVGVVENILKAFSFSDSDNNSGFKSLNDFNVVNAAPILKLPDGDFLLLQLYSLAEAIYESPFYWMAQDKDYLKKIAKSRGDFTEKFVAERLSLVFGSDNVHLNVDVFETKAKRVSDIDVLVVWGDRAIVIQTKSKRLTIESRKGNDSIIRDDFQKAVQDAYDQGGLCAKGMLNNKYKLVKSSGEAVVLPDYIKEIYMFCVVSDHYPALSFQARQFLKKSPLDRVQDVLVMDVFAIDAITEMLQSPLQFLSYLSLRANYSDQIMASHELTILGFHLKNNLWVQPDINLLQIGDDFSVGLDLAMTVRRTGIKGKDTPDGVLTRLKSTTIGRFLAEIDARPDPATIDLGFLLLAMSENAVTEMSRAVDRIAARTRADGELHDASFAFNEGKGITFHCTNEALDVAGHRLQSYCLHRKYRQRAGQWFGLCVSSSGPDVRFGVSLVFPWVQDVTMDQRTQDMKEPMLIDKALDVLRKGRVLSKKVGRNDPCPCGSGRKHKKCCLTG